MPTHGLSLSLISVCNLASSYALSRGSRLLCPPTRPLDSQPLSNNPPPSPSQLCHLFYWNLGTSSGPSLLDLIFNTHNCLPTWSTAVSHHGAARCAEPEESRYVGELLLLGLTLILRPFDTTAHCCSAMRRSPPVTNAPNPGDNVLDTRTSLTSSSAMRHRLLKGELAKLARKPQLRSKANSARMQLPRPLPFTNQLPISLFCQHSSFR